MSITKTDKVISHFFSGGNNYTKNNATKSIWGTPGTIITELIQKNVSLGDIVIDGPSGDGRYSEILCKTVGEKGKVINIDLDKKGLLRAKERLPERYSEIITILRADLTKPLPLDSASIDGFFCVGYAHLPNSEVLKNTFFPEVMRILKTGSSFFGNFAVDITRTNLKTGGKLPLVEFAEHNYTEKEGLSFLKENFPKLIYTIYRDLSFDYENTKPPYNWRGTSIVFEVLKT